VCSVLGPQRDFTDMTVAGAYTALSTKGVASLLSDTLWRALTFPITYLLVAVLVATALLQIRYVNRALQRFDSTQVIPTQFVLFTISVIVGSAILYRDFESATAERVGKFVGGCALTFLGVYLITSGRAHGGIDEEDDDDDEEGVIGLVDEERYQDNLGADGGESSQARRKSHISISLDDGDEVSLSQKLPPNTPKRAHSEISHAPRIRVTAGDESGYLSARSPPGATSPLLDNPWFTSQERPAPPRQPLQTTTSSPLLPFEAQDTVRPATPRFQTTLLPSPPKTDRPSTLSRRSMSRMMPGPLASPLSSSLSAIVADSLRRGVETSPTRRRPRLARLQKSTSQRTAGATARLVGEDPQGSSVLKSTQHQDDRSGSEETEE